MKRRRSPSPSSRHGQSSTSSHKGKGRESQRALRDLFGYQEIFLRILSFLSPTDLASVQSVNRHWSRMTLDPQVSQPSCSYTNGKIGLNIVFDLLCYSYGDDCTCVRLPLSRWNHADVAQRGIRILTLRV